ncbi:MAG: hypothetical protein LAQ30_14440, partial [Acidobacteriia bacterium]|nr:hypothetical protein [Terriglobia bacterium]
MQREIQIEDDVLAMIRVRQDTPPESSEIRHSSAANWPAALKPEAFHGLPGEWITMVQPHTEADPAALLVQFLVAFGSLIGRGPHYTAES